MDYTCQTTTNWFRVTDHRPFEVLDDESYTGTRDPKTLGFDPYVLVAAGPVSIDVDHCDLKDPSALPEVRISIDGSVDGIVRDADIPEGQSASDIGADNPDAFDDLVNLIQTYIDPTDACILLWIGQEGLRYLDGGYTVITKTGVTSHRIVDDAVDTAKHLLGNNNYQTTIY